MLDCKGACYPIATLNGDEACPLWQHASLQLQPSTAVSYGIWHYVHLTDDKAFCTVMARKCCCKSPDSKRRASASARKSANTASSV